MTAATDWGALLRAGVLGLRLPPSAVWDMAPCELTLLLGSAPAAFGRGELEALMRRHPDEMRESRDG